MCFWNAYCLHGDMGFMGGFSQFLVSRTLFVSVDCRWNGCVSECVLVK